MITIGLVFNIEPCLVCRSNDSYKNQFLWYKFRNTFVSRFLQGCKYVDASAASMILQAEKMNQAVNNSHESRNGRETKSL